MYERLKEKHVKIVFLDGTKINVIKGTFLDFSEEYKQIILLNHETRQETIISISSINKLEVVD